MPVWRHAIADALLEKRLLMQPGHNTTLVSLQVLRASQPLHLALTPLCAYRDYHSHGQGGWTPALREIDDGCEIEAFAGAQPYRLTCDCATFTPDPDWIWFPVNYLLVTSLRRFAEYYRPLAGKARSG